MVKCSKCTLAMWPLTLLWQPPTLQTGAGPSLLGSLIIDNARTTTSLSSRLVTIEVSDVLDHKLPLKSLHAQLHKSAPGYATRFDSHTDVSFSTKHLVVQVFTSVLYWVISYSHLPCWTRWSSWNRYTYRSKDITLPMFMIGLVTLPTGLLGAPGTSDRCDWAIKIFSPDGENLLPHVAAAYREVTNMMDRGRAKLMRQLDTTHCGNNSAPPPGGC